MRTVLTIISFFGIIISSCELNINKETKTGKIRNGIQFKAAGLKVEQAFLQKEEGPLLPADNKIELKEKIKLRLVLSGWKDKDSLVSVGATQKITTSTKVVLADDGDLFAKDSINTLTLNEARYINLSVVIDGIDELYDYFLIEFRVWDKKGGGEVAGSYKLYLK